MDYIDEIIVDYMEGNFDLEELEQADLDLVVARLQEIAHEKLLEGFDLTQGSVVHIGSITVH